MSRILVIPDIHHKVDLVNAIIKKEEGKYDKIIFTGDIFDNFDDDQRYAAKSAKWLKNSLTFENRIHLLGNHCAAFAFWYNPDLYCSGFSKAKSKEVNFILSKEDWRKVKLVHFEDGVCYSHAGINELLMGPMDDSYNQKYIEDQCEKALFDAENGIYNYILGAGMSRGGKQNYGGLLWGHYLEDVFPIKEFKQIIGHTPQQIPHISYLPNKQNAISWLLNLDTHLHHYAIVTDGIPEIYEVPDDMYEKYNWKVFPSDGFRLSKYISFFL